MQGAIRGADAVVITENLAGTAQSDKMAFDLPDRVELPAQAVADMGADFCRKFPAMALPTRALDLVLTKFPDRDPRRWDVPRLARSLTRLGWPSRSRPQPQEPLGHTSTTSWDPRPAVVSVRDDPADHHSGARRDDAVAPVFAQSVPGWRLAGVAAVFLHLTLKRLDSPLQPLQRSESLKDQGVLLRRTHAVKFFLRGALQFHTVSIAQFGEAESSYAIFYPYGRHRAG